MKPQNVSHSEEHSTSATRSSSTKEGMAPASSSKQPSTTAASGSISTILPRMSDPSPLSASNPASPQPMDGKPAPAGSQAASKDAGGSGTASPYGTRSRNRNGASRPNYAEDKDIDMDLFEMYPERRDDDPKRAATRQTSASNAAQAAAPRSVNGPSRKALPSDDTKPTAPQNSTKEHRHSSPAVPSNVTTAPANGSTKSKKRKAEPNLAPSASQTLTTAHANTSGAQKRQGAGSQSAATNGNVHGNGTGSSRSKDSGYSETNMLTFENCQARLQDGKMVADDGTVLDVNGELARTGRNPLHLLFLFLPPALPRSGWRIVAPKQ